MLTGAGPVQPVAQVDADKRPGRQIPPHPVFRQLVPEGVEHQELLERQVVRLDGKGGRRPGEGQHRKLAGWKVLAPLLRRTGMVDIVGERSIGLTPVKGHSKGVPEGSEGVAVLGVAGLWLWPSTGHIAEGQPAAQRPHQVDQPREEVLHGDGFVELLDVAHIEIGVEGHGDGSTVTETVLNPGRDHEGAP